MTKQENKDFIGKTEGLTKPVDITTISFLGDFNKYLPKRLQRRIMEQGSRKVPYMGFIVDPYCFFLAYEILDPAKAQSMLPEDYELAEASLFANEAKKPLVIISSFSVRTSVFTGMRVECYIIARNRRSGKTAWIIADYETNTTSHDPKNGFCGYSCDPALFTTTPYGTLLVEAHNPKQGNRFSLEADLEPGTMAALDAELWIEGNWMVDYGGKLRDPASKPFSLIFDPYLMKEAKAIPLDRVRIKQNSFLAGLIDGTAPVRAALFPYSQHFVIRQDLQAGIADQGELEGHIATFMNGKDFRPMAGSDITRPLLRGMLLSALANAAIIGLLLWLLLT